MGLFDFVENFFFIGLALLFVLVLLLVYHFKQRMNSVEKKGDNMYDLLTNVVKELRNIRTNVIGGISSQSQDVSVSPTTINELLVNTYIKTNQEVDSEDDADDSDEESVDSYDSSESSDSDSEIAEDGITYQIVDRINSSNEKRMVVSDNSESDDDDEDDEDDETDTEDDDDEDESDNEDDFEKDPVKTYTEDIPLDSVECIEPNSELATLHDTEEVHLDDMEIVYVEKTGENVDENSTHVEQTQPFTSMETIEINLPVEDITNVVDDIQPISRGLVNENLNAYKKMNVNQLKALAIQNGIQGDTSKLKKNALIDFLIEKQV